MTLKSNTRPSSVRTGLKSACADMARSANLPTATTSSPLTSCQRSTTRNWRPRTADPSTMRSTVSMEVAACSDTSIELTSRFLDTTMCHICWFWSSFLTSPLTKLPSSRATQLRSQDLRFSSKLRQLRSHLMKKRPVTTCLQPSMPTWGCSSSTTYQT